MAQISYQEKITRLENRLNELVKPAFVLADDNGNGSINSVIIMTNGQKKSKLFPTATDFRKFVEDTPDCNILINDTLLALQHKTLEQIMKELDTDTLKLIAGHAADKAEVEKLFYLKVLDKI